MFRCPLAPEKLKRYFLSGGSGVFLPAKIIHSSPAAPPSRLFLCFLPSPEIFSWCLCLFFSGAFPDHPEFPARKTPENQSLIFRAIAVIHIKSEFV